MFLLRLFSLVTPSALYSTEHIGRRLLRSTDYKIRLLDLRLGFSNLTRVRSEEVTCQRQGFILSIGNHANRSIACFKMKNNPAPAVTTVTAQLSTVWLESSLF